MPRRLEKTWADYVAIAISPAMIMLLLGSLMYFLLLAGYSGGYDGRLRWVLGWFVMAIVLIGRISMEEGAEKAVVYGLSLTGAMALAVARFIEQPLVAWGVLAVVWWSAHKLTWDCTLIDEQEDASGEGLLQVAGLDDEADAAAAAAPQNQNNKQIDPADTSLWRQLFGRRRKKVSAPGVWVVYFSLAALPLFGIGQWFIPAENLAARQAAFGYLVVYVGSALALLLSTAFLSLRRYLRQRKLSMPPAMTGLWIGSGALLIVIVLALCAVIPRPSPEYAAGSLTGRLSSEEQDASQHALLRDSGVEEGKGSAGENRNSQESRAESQEPDGSRQSQESRAESQEPDGSQHGKTGSGSQGGSQGKGSQGSQGRGAQSKGSQSKGSQGQSSQGKGSQGQRSQGQGQQQQSQQSQPSQQSQQNQAEQQSSQQQGEAGQQQESGEESSEKAQGEQAENSSSSQNEAPASEETQSEAEQSAESSESPQQPSDWMPQLPDFTQSLFLLGRWILNLVLILAAVFIVIRYWRKIVTGFQQLLDSCRNLLAKLRGRNPGEVSITEAAVVQAKQPGFADFPNPFDRPVRGVRTPEEAVAYSFRALEAWARDRGSPRLPQETPWEFADRLGVQHAPVARPVRNLAMLFARMNYADGQLPAATLNDVRTFWDGMELLEAAHAAAD